MKLIFLDIDGVLVTQRSTLAGDPWCASRNFDPVAVKILNKITSHADVRLVISSTWRFCEPSCRMALRVAGVTGIIYGDIKEDTAELTYSSRWWRTPLQGHHRGREIAEWFIESNPQNTESYAIIDDDSDFLPEQLPFFVKCDGEVGIGLKQYEKLLEILNLEHVM